MSLNFCVRSSHIFAIEYHIQPVIQLPGEAESCFPYRRTAVRITEDHTESSPDPISDVEP